MISELKSTSKTIVQDQHICRFRLDEQAHYIKFALKRCVFSASGMSNNPRHRRSHSLYLLQDWKDNKGSPAWP